MLNKAEEQYAEIFKWLFFVPLPAVTKNNAIAIRNVAVADIEMKKGRNITKFLVTLSFSLLVLIANNERGIAAKMKMHTPFMSLGIELLSILEA